MAFCRKCGKEIDDEAVVCVFCGVQQRELKTNVAAKKDVPQTNGGFGIVVGILCPLLGLIDGLIYLARGDSKGGINILGVSAVSFAFGLFIMFMNS